jgi:ATP-dependent protease ClpP protease subunit
MKEVKLHGMLDEKLYQKMMKEIDTDTETIYINSDGGVVDRGIEIYYRIREVCPDAKIVNEGAAHSIASVIFLAAELENRSFNKFATMLIHDPWMEILLQGDADELEQTLEVLRIYEAKLALIYADRTKMDNETIRRLMKNDYHVNSSDAKVFGIANYVNPVFSLYDSMSFKKRFEGALALLGGGVTPTAKNEQEKTAPEPVKAENMEDVPSDPMAEMLEKLAAMETRIAAMEEMMKPTAEYSEDMEAVASTLDALAKKVQTMEKTTFGLPGKPKVIATKVEAKPSAFDGLAAQIRKRN